MEQGACIFHIYLWLNSDIGSLHHVFERTVLRYFEFFQEAL